MFSIHTTYASSYFWDSSDPSPPLCPQNKLLHRDLNCMSSSRGLQQLKKYITEGMIMWLS
eukprot:c31775_g1_i1 orf=79-258(+)